MDPIIDTVKDHWPAALVTTAAAAIARSLRRPSSSPKSVFRSIVAYITAIREYETAIATAVFWAAEYEKEAMEAERERLNGLRWKERYEACMKECLNENTATMSRGLSTPEEVEG